MRKKLIEVALPLEAISAACEHEKSVPRKGHPATFHVWWARRPLAAARAVLFASLIDDPASRPDLYPTDAEQRQQRIRLFALISQLARWESSRDEQVLDSAREALRQSLGTNLPTIVDPFSGGATIPLEAQRLGLPAVGADLNPVAALIGKALGEIPPRFSKVTPVFPSKVLVPERLSHAYGLAADVRAYGSRLRGLVFERLQGAYPQVDLPGGGTGAAIAWLWCRTIHCANPACRRVTPLVRSFVLSTKKGREARVTMALDRANYEFRFAVERGPGEAQAATKAGRGARFRCVWCDHINEDQHIKQEGLADRLGLKLMAIVAEGTRGRAYVEPTVDHEMAAFSVQPEWRPNEPLPHDPRNVWCLNYGLTTYSDLFTSRQLASLSMLVDGIDEVRREVEQDALACGMRADGTPLRDGGSGASAYAEAIGLYLGLAVDKLADWCSEICTWIPSIEGLTHTFSKQAIPMTWDFAETNPFSSSAGNFLNHVEWVADSIYAPSDIEARFTQADASKSMPVDGPAVFATDPPYYDNISYSDLADFFYVWLKRSVKSTFPDLSSTIVSPKAGELVASPYRFGGDKHAAQLHFEEGLGAAFRLMAERQDPEYPLTVYYAFKQSEATSAGGRVSTGWETMLQALIGAGFQITGTWPIRTERAARSVAHGTGVLASSILLVCRRRAADAPLGARRELVAELRRTLPGALAELRSGGVTPVDLAQAAIGPGIAVYSQFSKVVEADGSAMSVRDALALINSSVDEVLSSEEQQLDADTRWATTWFAQHAFAEGAYGDAETLARARNTSVSGLVEAGIIERAGSRVRLLPPDEYTELWDPRIDKRLTVWETTHHLARVLEADGERGVADLLRVLGAVGDSAVELSFRLFGVCEERGWTADALRYNGLVVAVASARQLMVAGTQQELDFDGND